MKKRFITVFILIAIVTVPAVCQTNEELAKQVRETEAAFVDTMAMRDFKGFVSFLSHEAVFFGNGIIIRGKDNISTTWEPFFEGDEAPFLWEPEKVEVLDSGTLAFSTGTVYDSKGNRIGIFSSIWLLEINGKWKIIFNKGYEVSDQETLDTENENIKNPYCFYKPLPIYPDLARKARVKGAVVIQAVWDTDGRITKPRVVASPGKQYGFNDAALAAIKKWRCIPATVNGTKVEVYGNLTVNFTMP